MFKSRTLKLLKGLGNNSLHDKKVEKPNVIDNPQLNHVEKVMCWLESEFSDIPIVNENVQQNNYTFVDDLTTSDEPFENLMCVPVNTIDIVDNGPDENIDYYDLQNVCEETTSVKDIGHYNINETIVQSQDENNIIIELNEWNETSNGLIESTNCTENDEDSTPNISNVENIHNPESLKNKRSRWSQSHPDEWKKKTLAKR